MEETFQARLTDLQAARQYKFLQTASAACGAPRRLIGRHTRDKVVGVEEGIPNFIAPCGYIPTTGTANEHGMSLTAAWTDNLQVPSRPNEFHQLTKNRSNVATFDQRWRFPSKFLRR